VIPKDRKRLAKVDFPIAEVLQHAVAENTGWGEYPSTLHLPISDQQTEKIWRKE
jgi:hypothetical protein